MNRRSFMWGLRWRAGIWYSREETRDILKDYEERFDAGKAEGRTEGELCGAFGQPGGIVRERRQKLHGKKLARRIACLGGLAVLLALAVACLLIKKGWFLHNVEYWAILLAPPLLFLLLNGRKAVLAAPAEPSPKRKGLRIALLAGYIWMGLAYLATLVLAFCTIPEFFFSSPKAAASLARLPGVRPELLGPICFALLQSALAVILPIAALELYFWPHSKWVYPLQHLNAGLLFWLLEYHALLSALDAPATFLPGLLYSFLPMLVALPAMLLSIVALHFLPRFSGRGRKKLEKRSAPQDLHPA